MKTLFGILAFFSSLAFAAPGDRFLVNPNSGKNYSLCVNVSGTQRCPIVTNGSNGTTSFFAGATSAGGYDASGVWTFGQGFKLGGPGTQATLNDYETLDVSGAWTIISGGGTSGTAYVRMTRIGNQVTGMIRFIVSGTAGSLISIGVRDATGMWPTRFQPASLSPTALFHVGYCAKDSPAGAKFYVGLLQSGGTNYLVFRKDSPFGDSEDTGWCSFSYQLQ